MSFHGKKAVLKLLEKIKNHIQMDFYEVLLLQTTITTTSDSVAPSASGYTTETATATATKCHSSQPPMLHSSNLADGPIGNMEKGKPTEFHNDCDTLDTTSIWNMYSNKIGNMKNDTPTIQHNYK